MIVCYNNNNNNNKWLNKLEKNMSAVPVKKPYGWWDKGPPEPLSPAACSCSFVLPGCCGEDVYCSPKQNIISSSSVTPPQHWEGLAFFPPQIQPFSPVCPGAFSATPPADMLDMQTLKDLRRLWPLLYTASMYIYISIYRKFRTTERTWLKAARSNFRKKINFVLV